MRILSIIGTRPEAIKFAPIAMEAAGRPEIDHRILVTGQHPAIAEEALADFGISADHRLDLPETDSLDALDAALLASVTAHLATDRPHLVLVQGDTASALAGARAAAALGIAVGHVEAGLRSFDLAHPFPEERNRVAIDALADLLFAPTVEAARHLRAEQAVSGRIFITGNTGIDALLAMRARLTRTPPRDRPLILATCHRRESIGAGIAGICAALARLAARGDVDILLPLHPNPAVRDPITAQLNSVPGITLVEPLCYPAMVAAMGAARLILTDSGGVQEEGATLGVPVLVLRDVTERQEGIASGNLALVGTRPDAIVPTAARLLDDPAAHAAMAHPEQPFGDGRAAVRILDACTASPMNQFVQLRPAAEARNGSRLQ